MTRIRLMTPLILIVILLMGACGQNDDSSGGGQTQVVAGEGQICGKGGKSQSYAPSGLPKFDDGAKSLSGAGATFPAPIYSLWSSDYKKETGIEVAYQSIGSGGGVKQISEQTVDFGASDAPLKDSELEKAKGGKILHIPTVFGAVVPTYRIKGQESGLKFTGEVLGKIFAGQIVKWDDGQIRDLNPDANLPSLPIAVVHRSDGSGTTDIWTHYLAKVSPSWVAALGGEDKAKGKEVAWPVGIGGKGNEGVSAAVGQTEGAIGYVELSYAIEQGLTTGWVRNRAGNFIQPCIETVTAAAADAKIPGDLRFSLVDPDGKDAYPVSGATWLLVYENQTDSAKAKALMNYLAWIMDEGEKSASTLNYSPISSALRDMSIAKIKSIKLNGVPLAS